MTGQTLVDLFPDNVDYFDNTDQLLEEDDLVEMDIRIMGWSRKFRIRALTFEQMLKINTNATNKDTGLLDQDLFTYWTIAEGVTRPSFTVEKARRLKVKNGSNVQELSDQIWNIGRMSKKVFDEYIAELKRAAAEQEKDQSTTPTAKTKANRRR